MSYHRIEISKKEWHFQLFGTGDHLLIALHGFGEDSNVYARWEKQLSDHFTLLAVDLPFHGKTNSWPGLEFHPADFVQLIRELLDTHKKPFYSLVGHSFGARVLISIWEELHRLPATIWFLAPDGLATRRLGMANRLPGWLRKGIAGETDRDHRSWIKLARKWHSIGLLDAFSLRYLRYHLSNKERRRRLMGVWKSQAHFPVRKHRLLKVARNGPVPMHLVVGNTDDLINWKRVRNWLKKWPNGKLHTLAAGHQLINEQTAALIRSTAPPSARDD